MSEKCREIQMVAEQNKSRKTYQLIKEVNGKWKSKKEPSETSKENYCKRMKR
jgi:hypothetical protein